MTEVRVCIYCLVLLRLCRKMYVVGNMAECREMYRDKKASVLCSVCQLFSMGAPRFLKRQKHDKTVFISLLFLLFQHFSLSAES